jgi:hypothetical protein
MKLEDLLSCEWCGSVLDKNFLSEPDEPLNEYTCAVYECPSCRGEVFDYDE